MRASSAKVKISFAAAIAISATCASGQTAAAETLRDSIEQEIVAQTNDYRDRQGLAALSQEERLHKAAGRFADLMARRGQYGHRADGKTPSQRVKDAKYEPCTVRENIGLLELTGSPSAEDVAGRLMAGWIASAGHRRNLEARNIAQIGIGIARVTPKAPVDQPKRFYAVQLMATPREQAYRFSVRNNRAQAVNYTIDDKSFDLPPNTTHNHLRCTPPLIKATLGGEVHAYTPKSGEIIEF